MLPLIDNSGIAYAHNIQYIRGKYLPNNHPPVFKINFTRPFLCLLKFSIVCTHKQINARFENFGPSPQVLHSGFYLQCYNLCKS